MSRSLEAALVFPLIFVLLLLFAALALAPYPGLRDESKREVQTVRGSAGALLYQFSRDADGRPQLESSAERLLELLSLAEDNWSLLSSAYGSSGSAFELERAADVLSSGFVEERLTLSDDKLPAPLGIEP